ncbi:MAG: KpsF/GutQ family sugar-phosphate isomerase [Kiritimatiellae bacterium]|nr:KpsF/GutQ family sugar-phosphate isomerase [Kiritimatiellia bacterium]
MNHACERAKDVLNIEIAALEKVRDSLGAAFNEAAAVMRACLDEGGKIIVTGIGKNLHIGQKISATLASTGATSVMLNPAQAMHGDLGIVSEGDVLLALSFSGESDEILNVVPLMKRLGAKIVTLTGSPNSALAAHSDVVVPLVIEREACPFNMAPTASTTATLAVGDALAMVLLEARGFKKEDYAKLHPGGAIGRALLLHISDIMRVGKRVAVVKTGGMVKDAVMAMTGAKAGSAAVVDEGNRVVGIFTDGDLRRHISENLDLQTTPIDEVMTPSPITVRADQLAVDALKIYEQRDIDDLLVVDDQGRLVGAVDIVDLPKVKIL